MGQKWQKAKKCKNKAANADHYPRAAGPIIGMTLQEQQQQLMPFSSEVTTL